MHKVKDLKICLLADIHFAYKYNLKKFDLILDNVVKNKPDYICITGDIIDYVEVSFNAYIENLYNFIRNLAKVSKVIISLGNHDVTTFRKKYVYPYLFIENLKHMSNVILLDNNTYIDNKICFIGYTGSFDTFEEETGMDNTVIDEVSKLTKNIDKKHYNILLSHNPLYVTKDDVLNNISNHEHINLILSGHTHNGMLPGFLKTNRVLVTPSKKFFKNYGRGRFVKNMTNVVITGGVIKLSKRSGFLRYFNFLYRTDIDYILIDDVKK